VEYAKWLAARPVVRPFGSAHVHARTWLRGDKMKEDDYLLTAQPETRLFAS
jgi:hypothetical protein